MRLLLTFTEDPGGISMGLGGTTPQCVLGSENEEGGAAVSRALGTGAIYDAQLDAMANRVAGPRGKG